MSQQTEQRRIYVCTCARLSTPCPVHEPDTYEMWQVEQDMERLKEDLANDD